MKFITHPCSIFPLALSLAILASTIPFCQSQTAADHSKATGKQVFISTCAGCHGIDGRGAERAPDIAGNPKIQQLPDAKLYAIVVNGIPGTAMPPFRSLGPAVIKSIVVYLRTLQGVGTAIHQEDSIGKSLFFGKAGCSSCHMVEGTGGFLGSDLSNYAANHSTDEIRGVITDPTRNTDWRRTEFVAITADGQSFSGIARNEDNFSIQLQTADGKFHFFEKSQLRSLEHQSKPLMPSDYASLLSREEIDHLMKYLMSTAVGKKRERSHENEE